MTFAIVGNNDGPLFLLRSLKGSNLHPVFVGLQKPVSSVLREEYMQYIKEECFFEGIDENSLLQITKKNDPGILFNVFCNFRFTGILDKYTVLNIHPAPLPRYRGRHPMHWALINGEKEFAISIHKMEKEIDAGAILWQKFIKIKKGMSVRELRSVLMNELQSGFAGFLKKYADGKIKTIPHSDKKATYVARRYPEDSLLCEWGDSKKIIRKVLALRSEANPAYLKINGKKINLMQAEYGKRNYEGFSVPFVTRLEPDGFEALCLDGKTIFFSGISMNGYNIQLNDRIEL
ncbi:MAG TPA: formyltransferase family protein [Chitinophagaceae bacterium]|nr:formyltransferase family protein [Chitinophagaceae bacterium]